RCDANDLFSFLRDPLPRPHRLGPRAAAGLRARPNGRCLEVVAAGLAMPFEAHLGGPVSNLPGLRGAPGSRTYPFSRKARSDLPRTSHTSDGPSSMPLDEIVNSGARLRRTGAGCQYPVGHVTRSYHEKARPVSGKRRGGGNLPPNGGWAAQPGVGRPSRPTPG